MAIREEANYRPHPDNTINGNPLIECLHPLLEEKEIKRRLTFKPVYADKFAELHPFYKSLNVRRLWEVYIPSDLSTVLYWKFFEYILDSYRYRNPLSSTMARFVDLLAEENRREGDNYLSVPPGMTIAPGSVVTGPSGSGKTSGTRGALKLIPQVISHAGYRDANDFYLEQLVWTSFDCPPTGSMKDMTLNFMKSVDDALQTTYFREWEKRRKNYTVEAFIVQAQIIAANHYIGLVHIDELQFMLKYKSEASPDLIKLEAMFNKIGVPIITSTTSEGMDLFDLDLTSSRRMMSERIFKILPVSYSSAYADEFIAALFPTELWGDNVQKNHPHFLQEFFELTAGLQAVMVRLARLHLDYCTKKELSNFDINILNRVFDSQFEKIQPALLLLKINNLKGFEEKFSQTNLPEVFAEESDDASPEALPAPVSYHRPVSVSQVPAKAAEPFNPSLLGFDDDAVR
jgi:hypothetical protein